MHPGELKDYQVFCHGSDQDGLLVENTVLE